jgi:prepilin-type N-terminal cleavage/methylation domain-containing protein
MRPNFTGGDLADAIGTRISKGTDLCERLVQRRKGVVGGKLVGARKRTSGAKAWVGAFTLIELLAVIAIIGLLAGLVLSTAGLATRKMREARMKAEHQKIVTGIESYKADMANYPPDNQDTTLSFYKQDNGAEAHIKAGKNPLFYELSGCTFDSASGGTFTTQHQADSVTAANLRTVFGVKGVENSARNKKDITYRGLTFKPNEFAEIDKFPNVQILVTPLPGPWDNEFLGKGGIKKLNPWFYDASSTNRHNLESYDLWTEYKSSDGVNGVKIIGNW